MLWGGGGSGKSNFISRHLVVRAATEKDNRYIVFRKHYRQLRESVFAECCRRVNELGLGNHFVFMLSPMQIVCKTTGSVILFMGLDNQEKVKSTARVSTVWFEEATEFSEDDFWQIDKELSKAETKYPKRYFLSFNPISQQNWVYGAFFAETAERAEFHANALRIKTTYRDNPYLSADAAEFFERAKTLRPRFYAVYGNGEWGTPEDLVVGPLPEVDRIPDAAKLVCYGLDFGFNDPCALVAIYRDDGVYYVKELLYRTQLTVGALADVMKEMQVEQYVPIYFDSSRPEMAAGLRAAGYLAQKANKSVAAGLDALKSHKEAGRLFTLGANVNLNKELAVYAWRKDRDGHILEEPEDGYDHGVDALRYGLFTHLKYSGYGSGLTF